VAECLRAFRHAGFFVSGGAGGRHRQGRTMNQLNQSLNQSDPAVAQEIARVACAFEQRLTGRAPRAVAVVLSGETLVVTLHGALSPAERALARSPAGAAQVQEFHRQLFASTADWLRREVKRITGVEVREAAAEVEPATGAVVQAFTTGTVVQVFLLAGSVPADTWSGGRVDGSS
jgi:uncharacterized protein YbcI